MWIQKCLPVRFKTGSCCIWACLISWRASPNSGLIIYIWQEAFYLNSEKLECVNQSGLLYKSYLIWNLKGNLCRFSWNKRAWCPKRHRNTEHSITNTKLNFNSLVIIFYYCWFCWVSSQDNNNESHEVEVLRIKSSWWKQPGNLWEYCNVHKGRLRK